MIDHDGTTGAQPVPSRGRVGLTSRMSVAIDRPMRCLNQLLPPAGRPLLSRLNPKITISVVFILAMFMAIMDIAIVNVALPTLA
jgi:hypothetical protein